MSVFSVKLPSAHGGLVFTRSSFILVPSVFYFIFFYSESCTFAITDVIFFLTHFDLQAQSRHVPDSLTSPALTRNLWCSVLPEASTGREPQLTVFILSLDGISLYSVLHSLEKVKKFINSLLFDVQNKRQRQLLGMMPLLAFFFFFFPNLVLMPLRDLISLWRGCWGNAAALQRKQRWVE